MMDREKAGMTGINLFRVWKVLKVESDATTRDA